MMLPRNRIEARREGPAHPEEPDRWFGWVAAKGGRWIKAGLVSIAVVLGVALMITPLLVVTVAAFSETGFADFPPRGFTFEWYLEVLQDADYLGPAILSLWVSALATVIDVFAALCLALGLEVVARRRIAVRRFHLWYAAAARGLALSPMLFPSVVIGVALLLVVPRLGLYDSPSAILVAHIILVFPFTLVLVEGGLAASPDSVRRSAESLGASPVRVVWHIVLPLARMGIVAAGSIAFVLSIGQVTVDAFLQGTSTITLPVFLLNEVTNSPVTTDLTAAASLMALITTGLIVLTAVALSRLQRAARTSVDPLPEDGDSLDDARGDLGRADPNVERVGAGAGAGSD